MNLVILPVIAWCVAGFGARADVERPARVVTGDVLIRNGTVIDGTGAPGRPADVLIVDDRIVHVGSSGNTAMKAKHVIDATGMVVTPGFIDTHAHGDPRKTPVFANALAMGVTTICLGQDGDGPENPARWIEEVTAARPGPNIVAFAGHGTIRNLAGVGLSPDPTSEQLRDMQKLVEQALADGCFGLTTGLEYQPGCFAGLDELIAVARPVADAGGLIMSHLRSEDDDAIEAALDELLGQGETSGCHVHVSHIKVTYGRGKKRAEQILARLQAARNRGVRVTADCYPYLASYTGIGIVFPDWAKPPHDYRAVVKARRQELAEYLKRRVVLRNGPQATLFGTEPWMGQTLAQVAKARGEAFEDVLIDAIGPDGAKAAYFVMDASLQERLLLDPQVMICSDGSPTAHHPRGHGAFAKVIGEYVVRRKLFTLEDAIFKMTGLAAKTVGLDRIERGLVAKGFAADLLVFDPAKVRGNATYEKPHVLASGFDYVLVNGRVVRKNGRFTGIRPGRALKRPAG